MSEGTPRGLSWRDYAGFLIGRRDAILAIAASPGAVWVSALLMVTGSFARNYDRPGLIRMPWRMLGSPVASLIISGAIFALVHLAMRLRKLEVPGWASPYRSVLAVYWATSPIAWLYAIPFEAFLSTVDATRANLNLLTFVSIWRVALFTRALGVIYGLNPWKLLPFVLLVSSVAVALGIVYSPVPLIIVMSGADTPPEAIVVSDYSMSALALSALAAPASFIAVWVCAHYCRPTWAVPEAGLSALRLTVQAGICVVLWLMLTIAVQR